MRAIALIALLPLVTGHAYCGVPLADTAEQIPDVVRPLLKSVVNISVLKHLPGEDNLAPVVALGSGFVISANGEIVTNKHVVENGYSVTVAFDDGSTFPAEIKAVNARPDLALLKIDPDHELPFVRFGNSDALSIGEPVIAIGNPLGLASSVSVGVVSALNRDINLTMIDDFIQTDAAINHGNSGGPLFNMRGEVIGINWAIFAPGQQTGSAGLGFAIPSRDAEWVLDEMRRFGRLRAGFIGLRIQEVTADMQSILKLPSRKGGIISGVLPEGPAAKAGLHDGDVIVEFNGQEPHDVRALLRDISASAPGSQITLTIRREGTTSKRQIDVASWPDNPYNPAGAPQLAPIPRKAMPDLGMQLAPAAEGALAASPFHAAQRAIRIVAMAPDSAAADVRLNSGDLILQLGSLRVETPDQFHAELERLRSAGERNAILLVETKSGSRWVVVRL